jgi:tetratricopeptide (TPR) repeat protein
MLTLEQIQPEPRFDLPSTSPSTADAPLDALDLYARARDARARNQPFTAINLLEQAIKLDPASHELYFALGSAYQRVNNADKAIQSYERAAAIKPDDLILQAELGRAYMQKGDAERGIQHLRLARMTDDYRNDAAFAAAVDYRLGLALQQAGYDRAALDVYDSLLRRLRNATDDMRRNPEIALLMNRPEFLLEQVGALYEKHGQYDDALSAWQLVAQRAPEDFAARARVVNTLLAMGRTDEALTSATELVAQFRASPESLALLREAYRRAGRQQALVDELRRLRRQRPQDRVVLFALSDALDAVGRTAEAEQLLTDAAEQRDGDAEIIARLVDLYVYRGQLQSAARMLVEASARRPTTTSELLPLWNRLTSPGRRDALRVDDLRRLRVGPVAEPARLYFLSRVARSWSRESIAQSALQQSVAARPIFPPAFREMLDSIWSEQAYDEQQRRRHNESLITAARDAGSEALALELEGAALLAQKKAADATRVLAEAARRADPQPPELQLTQASAELAENRAPRFEQLAWRLISARPRFEPTYPLLFRHYMERGNAAAARNLLTTWLANVPDSVEPRLIEATIQARVAGQRDQAERFLLAIFAQHPDRIDVLANLRALYSEWNQLPRLIDLLEQQRALQPYNYALVAQLVDIYASQKRNDEAMRALDAARASLADDPDRLYFVAQLYQRIDQQQQGEEVLQQILDANPSFAPAGNDLGYTWADAGKNLDRAESMIRRAVEAEPDNPMFLDSLGWVLYKQGRFDEARRHLERAAADERGADPVILDHLGDALYRLNQSDDAVRRWRDSLARIAAAPEGTRQQHNALRLQLDQKLKQAEQRQPVSVAPVAGESRAQR